jgi:RNA polymerase sigma-70 factor (ECF subfamily)
MVTTDGIETYGDPKLGACAMPEDPNPNTVGVADLEQLYVGYVDRVYRFLYARVGNREDAEDLASETFLKASRMVDFGRSESSIAAWLFTVARTVLADHWRRHYRAAPRLALDDAYMESATATRPSEARQSETEAAVEATLAVLTVRDRRVLELRFLRGYTLQETARELGVSLGNAKVLQHRALARAARMWADAPPSVGSCSPKPSAWQMCPQPAA